MKQVELKAKLDQLYFQFNQPAFIQDDPISIPKFFSKKEDIEIMAFLISSIAWGQRTSIINSGKKLMEIFEHAPYQFIIQHKESDLKRCLGFVHRTFNELDLISFVSFLKEIYQHGMGLEGAFANHINKQDTNTEKALNGFRKLYEQSNSYVKRTSKHIAYPAAGSACKRINMFLRWMVREDESGVDFGLWKSISTAQLICPLDVHVINEAFQFGLISSEKSNWRTAIELTENLKHFDSQDPVKYDFALFGSGIQKKQFNKLQELGHY